MSAKIGVSRSLVPTMEKDKQGVSKATAEKLYATWGVNMTWLLTGDGEPLGEPPENLPQEQIVINEKEKSYDKSIGDWMLFTNPSFYLDAKNPGRFGYVKLTGTKLKLHAARDGAIAGTQLFRLIEDDKVWFLAGEPNGWEFEMLRCYFDFGKDRALAEWMGCLRIIRWQRELLIESQRRGEERREARSA